MSGMKWARFYFSDWMSDEGVRACSLGARGLWMDLLCIAGTNQGDDHGYVRIAGKAPTVEQIARRVGATVEEVETYIRELEDSGVFSRTKVGVIYCRRMVRAEKNRRNGGLGGNPNLKKTIENKNPVQPTSKPLIPRSQESKSPEEHQQSQNPADRLCVHARADARENSDEKTNSQRIILASDLVSDDQQVVFTDSELRQLEAELPALKNLRGAARYAMREFTSGTVQWRKRAVYRHLVQREQYSLDMAERRKQKDEAAAAKKKAPPAERDWKARGVIP